MKSWALLALLLAAQAVPAPAHGQDRDAVAELCRVPNDLIADLADFPNAVRDVVDRHRLVIVAIGAASTAGTGATSPRAAWPARLEAMLAERMNATDVKIINLGERGLTASNAVVRMARELKSLRPDLVIWETGTVEAVRTEDPDQFAVSLMEGVDLAGELHADLILMTPQYARETERMINFQPYLDAMEQTAGLPGVNLFPRHAVMRYWAENERLVPATRVEMRRGNDQIYNCIAYLLADVIERGLNRAHAAR